MELNDTDIQRATEKQLIPSDTAELPKPSRWEEFVLTLKLMGFAAVVLALIWAIEVFKNG
jgi:hypothetical protein